MAQNYCKLLGQPSHWHLLWFLHPLQGFMGQALHTLHLQQRRKRKKRWQHLFYASPSQAAATACLGAQLRGGKARDQSLQTPFSIPNPLVSPQKWVYLLSALSWGSDFNPPQTKDHCSVRRCEKKRVRRAGWITPWSLPKFPTIYHSCSTRLRLCRIRCFKTRSTCLKLKVSFEVVWIYTRAWFSGQREVTEIIPHLGLQTGPS